MRDSEHANEIRPAKIATTKGFKWGITGQRVFDEGEVIFPNEQHAKMFCDTYNTGVAQYRRTFGGEEITGFYDPCEQGEHNNCVAFGMTKEVYGEDSPDCACTCHQGARQLRNGENTALLEAAEHGRALTEGNEA